MVDRRCTDPAIFGWTCAQNLGLGVLEVQRELNEETLVLPGEPEALAAAGGEGAPPARRPRIEVVAGGAADASGDDTSDDDDAA